MIVQQEFPVNWTLKYCLGEEDGEHLYGTKDGVEQKFREQDNWLWDKILWMQWWIISKAGSDGWARLGQSRCWGVWKKKTWKHFALAAYVNWSLFYQDDFGTVKGWLEGLGDFHKDYSDGVRYYSKEKMVRRGDQSEGSGEWKWGLARMEVGMEGGPESLWGVESSKFGCQLNAGNRGESGVKGVPEAVTWETQRNRECAEAFLQWQANQADMQVQSCSLRLGLVLRLLPERWGWSSQCVGAGESQGSYQDWWGESKNRKEKLWWEH